MGLFLFSTFFVLKLSKKAYINMNTEKQDGWHWPLKDEFPKDEEVVLTCTRVIGIATGLRRKNRKKYEWYISNYDGTSIFKDSEVIAWQFLPEPPES